MEDENSGHKKSKKHVGDFRKVTWDKEGLLKEAKAYPDGHQVNWSELACCYQITSKADKIASNEGQTAHEFIVSKGKNIHRFASVSKKHKLGDTDFSPSIIHRKKLRVMGGEISFLTMEIVEQIKEKLLKSTRW